MIKKRAFNIVLPLLCSCFLSNCVFAAEIGANNVTNPASFSLNKDNMKQIKNSEFANDLFKIITFTQPSDMMRSGTVSTDYSKLYDSANGKYAQGNITSAYKDYKAVITGSNNDDFVNLGFAYRFANLGLFSLSQEAINNIQDNEIYGNQISLIKKVFFPKNALSYDEEIYLAQSYTELYFNNLAFEVVRELSKNQELLKKSDYANYILAQAYLNLKEYNRAINAVNKALSMSDNNANYLKLKAQIYCENNKYSDSIKTIDSILTQNVQVMNYNQDIEALKYFVLAKANKDRNKSKYYLASYFDKSSDSSRAIKELNQNVFQNKKDYNSLTKLGDIYLAQKDTVKAMEMYQRAYKLKKNEPDTLIGIGDVYLSQKNYKNAVDYYTRALKKEKLDAETLVNVAYCYKMLNIPDKASDFTARALKANPNSDKVYYTMAQIDDIYATNYLKKAITINPMNTDAWMDLAYNAIRNKQSGIARGYLEPVKYIDKNNYRYFYISGLIKKQEGNLEGAGLDFQKSQHLNPSFEDARKELSSPL